MQMLNYLRQLNFTSMVVRMLLAMIVGGMIGFEREKKRRPAGFRTYMLVALGAALPGILSQYLDLLFSIRWDEIAIEVGRRTIDASRFGARVVSGIGFIGAGTILVTERQEVKGLTTAAGLWASACMGLAAGAGFYECVIIGFILLAFCMWILPLLESLITAYSQYMNVFIEMDTVENLGEILNKLKNEKINLFNVDMDKEQHEHISQINALFNLKLPRKQNHAEVLALLSTIDGIISIEEV